MKAIVTALLVLIAANSANAATITFESVPVGPIAGDTLVVPFGTYNVTFQGVGLQIRQFNSPFPNSRVLSTFGDSQPITVTISNGFTFNFANVTNIINGTYTSEIDVISGTAFSASNTVLDTETSSATVHTLNGPGIARVVYDDVNTGYILDNFEFEVNAAATVPEPSSFALFGVVLGLGAGCYFYRRRVVAPIA